LHNERFELRRARRSVRDGELYELRRVVVEDVPDERLLRGLVLRRRDVQVSGASRRVHHGEYAVPR